MQDVNVDTLIIVLSFLYVRFLQHKHLLQSCLSTFDPETLEEDTSASSFSISSSVSCLDAYLCMKHKTILRFRVIH